MVAGVSTAVEAAASTVVALMEVATMVVGPTAAIAAAVRCTAVADMEGWAEGRHRRAIPAEEERGPRRAEAFGTPRRDGIRLRDPVAAGAEMVRARLAFTGRSRMGSGILSEEPTERLDRG